jgi:glycosyltransferase involved in cell wall biosynthesis
LFYSIIIPVYNRPDEIEVVLNGLVQQTFTNFEVCIVESGSEIRKSDKVVEKYKNSLDIHYYLTGNNGPGLSRNVGLGQAKGDYFIILDSDILLENDFMFQVNKGIVENNLDAHGGPDRCHDSFSDIEKAFNYSLTSFFTTGGMRGGTKRATKFHPRSFNMGLSRKVYETVGGFKFGFLGEDIELSHRIINAGFKVDLIPQAFVYHHRKKDYRTFFKHMAFFGKARINIMKNVPNSLKLIHLIPTLFVLFVIGSYLTIFINLSLFIFCKSLLYTYLILIFLDSTQKNKSLKIGFLSVGAVIVQFFGYGIGFMDAFFNRVILPDKNIQKNI